MSLNSMKITNNPTITVLNPQDGSYVGEVKAANELDVSNTINTAVNAFEKARHGWHG